MTELISTEVKENPIVMYLIVRESLNMSLGKTAAQVGHAVSMLMVKYFNVARYPEYITPDDFNYIKPFSDWLNTDYRKVVLKADEKEWAKLKEQLKDSLVVVVDNGLTELAPKTETVIGLLPMKRSDVPKVLKRLQALK